MVDQGHKAVFKQSNVVLVLVTKISFKKLMNIYLIKKKRRLKSMCNCYSIVVLCIFMTENSPFSFTVYSQTSNSHTLRLCFFHKSKTWKESFFHSRGVANLYALCIQKFFMARS